MTIEMINILRYKFKVPNPESQNINESAAEVCGAHLLLLIALNMERLLDGCHFKVNFGNPTRLRTCMDQKETANHHAPRPFNKHSQSVN